MLSRFQVEDGATARRALDAATQLRIEISQFAGDVSFRYQITGDVELRDATAGHVNAENVEFFERLVSRFLRKGGAA